MFYRVAFFIAALVLSALPARALPTRVIAMPSAEVLEYGEARFEVDNYNTFMKKGADGGWNMINYGFTYGLIPYTVSKSWGMELGFDYRDLNGSVPAAADSPLFFNFKFAMKEGTLFSDNAPAIAFGIYDYGGKSSQTNANIMYLALGKSFLKEYKAGVGFYSGNGTVLVDSDGKASGSGPMASLEWQPNKQWWFAIDYLGGGSRYASMNLGGGYLLANGVKMVLGYDMYGNSNVKPTFTFQLLIEY